MGANAASTPGFRVGEWLVRPSLAKIQRGENAVHLTPRAMAVLVKLAAAKGAVVSRNELLDTVWPRMAVTQDALSQCIVELRRAFGDDSKRPNVIETIPKIGLRLVPPVAPLEDEPAVAPAIAAITSAGGAVPSQTPRLRARLAVAVVTAVVIASGAVWLLADRAGPSAAAGGQAAATTADTSARDFYLSGNDHLRRTNRLDALKYEEDQYRRAVSEDPTFASAWARLSRTHAAFHWYGLDRSPGRCALAEQAIRKALELDPQLPEAHLYLANYEHRCRGDADKALAEFAIAEQSSSDNAELYFLRSSVHRQLGDWERAIADGGRAVELDSRNAVYQRQQHISYLMLRDYASAERILDRLDDLNPEDGTIQLDKVVLALVRDGDTGLARRYDEAPPTADYTTAMGYTYTRWLVAVFDRDYDKAMNVLASSSENPSAIVDGDLRNYRTSKALLFARTLALAGNHEQAQREYQAVVDDAEQRLDRQVEEDPTVTQALTLALAEARVGLGQTESARAIVRGARETWSTVRADGAGSALRLAYVIRVLVPLGDRDETLAELDAYLSGVGHWSIEGLLGDPRLDRLRTEQRFQELIAKYRRQ